MGQKSRCSLVGCLLHSTCPEAAVRVPARSAVSAESSAGEGHASEFTCGLMPGFFLSCAVKPRPWSFVGKCLLPRERTLCCLLQQLLMGALHRAAHTWQLASHTASKQSEEEGSHSFCNLISGVTSHHLC